MTDCHYRRLGTDGDHQVFESTVGTASNWNAEIQHGSPPLALMTKAIEELAAPSRQRVGRVTLDILGAIPVAPVKVRSWVMRPGARISLLAAEMTPVDGGDRAVARVTAWLLATSDTSDAVTDRYPPLEHAKDLGHRHSSSRAHRRRTRTAGRAHPAIWRRSAGAASRRCPAKRQWGG